MKRIGTAKGRTGENGPEMQGVAPLIKSLEKGWQRLVQSHLPVAIPGSVWRANRPSTAIDPEQGWKLHLSATVLSASEMLKRVVGLLEKHGVLFKAPRSLEELNKINSGLYYGFSQVGKCMTVYPKDSAQAVFLARKLHKLTLRFPGPSVPYDMQLAKNSRVFYRYGSFKALKAPNKNNERVSTIRDLDGRLHPDRREPGAAIPGWLEDPFRSDATIMPATPVLDSLLKTTIRAYEAISQRGKGGVYRAVDLSVLPARQCILKEGRRHGETGWDGRDGYWRVRYEARVLSSLSSAGVPVPAVYLSFKSGLHCYLALEWVMGRRLSDLMTTSKEKLPTRRALGYGIQAARLMHQIHSAGWAWRDCKPQNLIVAPGRALRPVDFEGACRIRKPDPFPWGTPGFMPPESFRGSPAVSPVGADLYALGVTLYCLISGQTPTRNSRLQLKQSLKRKLPPAACMVLMALMDDDPKSRPSALSVTETLIAVR